MINIQKHIISEAFELLSNFQKLNEAQISEPKYRDGDVVFTGDASGYHGTFLIDGDFRKIPKELYSNIRRIYKYGNIDKPYYKVEYRIDSDSLSEKDYAEFFTKIIPMLHDVGISVLKSAKDIKESKLTEDYYDEYKMLIDRINSATSKADLVDIDRLINKSKYADDARKGVDDSNNYLSLLQSLYRKSKEIIESKLTEAPDTMSVKDFAAKMRARKAALKSENVLDKIKSQLTPDMSVEDLLEVYFNELVPSSGPAKTIAGELIRSIMRILYRDYNDGDLWYTGYGKETCGSSVIYIINHIKDLFRNFEKMSSYQLEEEDYTNALNDIAAKILVYLNENPELFTTPSNEDSRNTKEDLDDYFDLPTYEFDVDASYDEDYYDVSDEEIDDFIHDIVRSDLSSGRVNRWASDAWTIEDLEKDDYNTLEDMWEKWFSDFLSEYEREEEPEDEEYDEEEDFDESLKESIGYKKKVDDDRFKRSMLTLKIFYEYPDISVEDEDYLNSLSYDALIKECRNRGWEDLLKDWENELKDFDESLKEASKTNKIQPFTVMFFHVEDDDFSTNTGIMYGKNEQEVRDKFARYCPSCKIDRVKKGILGFDYPMITSTFEYDMGWREEEFEDEEDFDESLKEDTVKQGNKWVNKGKEGTHGKFDTKKEADAQRKAMFASGWKG